MIQADITQSVGWENLDVRTEYIHLHLIKLGHLIGLLQALELRQVVTLVENTNGPSLELQDALETSLPVKKEVPPRAHSEMLILAELILLLDLVKLAESTTLVLDRVALESHKEDVRPVLHK